MDGSNRSQLTIESKENDSNHKYTFTVGSIQNIKSLTVRNLKIIETTSGPTSNLFTKGNLLTLEKVDYTGPPITLHITGGKPAIDIKITDSNIVIDKDQGAGEARNIDLYGTNNFHVRASGLFSVFRVSDNVILHENSVNTFDSNRRMFFSFSPTDYPTLLIKEGAEFHFIGGNVSYNVMEVRSIENNGLINIESAKTSNEIIESKGSITNNGDIIINNTGNATLIKANSFIQNTNLERPSTVNLYSSNGSFFSTGMKINTQKYNKWVDKPNYTFFSGTFAPSRENETIYKTKEFTLNKDTSKKHLSFGNIVYTDVMQDDREWVSFRTNPNACVQVKLDNSSSTSELFDCVNDFANKPLDECVVKGVANDACYAKADANGIVKAKLPSKIANGEYGVKIIANNLLREDAIKYDVEGFLEIISVTENINFGNIKLSETPNTVYNRVDGNVINVEISDERSIQTGWVLSVYLKTPLSVVNSPTNTLSDSPIFKKGSKNDTIKIGFDNRLTIAETSGTYDSNQTLSFNENEGVLINIENYAKVLTSQPYTTELVWVLEAKEP